MLWFLLAIGIGQTVGAVAEIRTPLLLDPDMLRYRLPRDYRDDDCIEYETIKIGYSREAHETYYNGCDSCLDDPSDDTTTYTEPLARLWFGKSEFRGEEAFSDGILINRPSNNPWLSFAQLRPRFEYNESGAVFGFRADYRFGCDKKWRLGGVLRLPVKVVEVECNCCGLEEREETLGDVRACKDQILSINNQEEVETPIAQNTCAYRLDFLSSLFAIDGVTPLVSYGNGTNVTMIAGQIVGAANETSTPVHLIKRDDGTIPNQDFADPSASNGTLSADGSGTNNGRYFFNTANDYASSLATDRDAQGTLFIVPREVVSGGLDANAVVIQNAVEQVLTSLDQSGRTSSIQFFRDCGIIICDKERTVGVGDLDLDFSLGYEDHCWYGDFITGIRLPTADVVRDPRHVLKMPTGNNGHAEIKVGMDAGYRPYQWLGLSIDASYSHVFEHVEAKAAPFTGATIRNIGPITKALVSWDYFVGQFNGTFFHPKDDRLGFVLGYQFYAKRTDDVTLCFDSLRDCLGSTTEYELDGTILENGTKTHSHKIRSNMFYRFDFWEVYGGASHVVAGKNAMKETEWYVGMNVWF